MADCASSGASGGPQCLLGNNGLSSQAPTSKAIGSTYAEIAKLEQTPEPDRPGVYFQTVGSPLDCQAMSVATAFHASSVEVWPPIGRLKGFSAIPVATLAQWNQDLIQGHPITC